MKVTTDGINLLYDCIKANLLKCQVYIDGSYRDVEIESYEETDTSIKVFVYMDETYVGTIAKYRLIMINGKVFDERSDTITKDDTRGLLTLFEYKIKEA